MIYELMVILSPKQTDKKIEKNLKEIRETLTENECEMGEEDLWGERNLAYKIGPHLTGYYAVLNFTGESKALPEIHKDLRLNTAILRYLLVKMPSDYTLIRYDQPLATRFQQKLSAPAEELAKKVRTKRATKAPKEAVPVAKEEAEKEAEETSKTKLDETLQAIVENADIDL